MFLNVFFQEYEAEFGPSEQSDVNDKEETEVFFHLPDKIDYFKVTLFSFKKILVQHWVFLKSSNDTASSKPSQS